MAVVGHRQLRRGQSSRKGSAAAKLRAHGACPTDHIGELGRVDDGRALCAVVRPLVWAVAASTRTRTQREEAGSDASGTGSYIKCRTPFGACLQASRAHLPHCCQLQRVSGGKVG